ncbi:MAG: hypothetical protein LBQ24_04575 [Candidatus Peribacteria bacterium]|jgi:hypothetical protein|nr:hypothetical protein [Candidatus Peribacteria bacterium]
MYFSFFLSNISLILFNFSSLSLYFCSSLFIIPKESLGLFLSKSVTRFSKDFFSLETISSKAFTAFHQSDNSMYLLIALIAVSKFFTLLALTVLFLLKKLNIILLN